MKAFLTLVLLSAAGVGGWYGYQRLTARPTSDEFVLAPIDRGDIIATVSATGTIEPTTKVLVGSQVSGTVTKWHADFNAPVRLGDLLVELDPERYKTELMQRQASVKMSEARVEEADVRLRDARREETRLSALRKTYAASENEYQIARMQVEAATASLHAAQAQLELARAELNSVAVDLSRTRILSPLDGVVISRDIDVGQTVAASLQAPTLYTIASDLRQMQVQANVAESDIGRVREDMTASFRVDAYPERRFRGRVSQVRYNPTVVDNIVTYVTIIEVENPDLLLRPGMTATVTFEVAKIANALRVPNAALRFSPEGPPQIANPTARGPGKARGPQVYQLVDGKPKSIQLDIGLTDGSFTEVRGGGLNAGDTIILDRRWSSGAATRSAPPRGPRMM